MTPTTSRVLRAIADSLADRDLTDCAGGTVSVVVKLDVAGCPKRVAIRTEIEADVARARPRAPASAPMIR